MTNDLLDVSRLEEGKMPIERAVWDLTQMASDVRAALAAIDRERPIDIESAGARARRPATAASSAGSWRTSSATGSGTRPPAAGCAFPSPAHDGRVRVAVHDQGRGVPPEAREKIFEKFGTVEARHERTYHSVGLGLAFCKLAIEAQGGTIGVDSGVPAGSTFWFELPA